MVKSLNARFDDHVFEKLQEIKGSRSWPEAIREEFGVET